MAEVVYGKEYKTMIKGFTCKEMRKTQLLVVQQVNKVKKLKCENCGEVTDKETCVSLGETLPLAKKGTTHLIQIGDQALIFCKFCKREGTVTMIPSRGSPLTHDYSETEKYAPLMIFDCRGFEPMAGKLNL
ncbi:hypothetical protein R6Q59_033451 [Mikania micrantha]